LGAVLGFASLPNFLAVSALFEPAEMLKAAEGDGDYSKRF